MDFEEYRKGVMEEVKAQANTSGEGSDASFFKFFSDVMVDSEICSDAISPAFYEGEGRQRRKLRVDGYLYDQIDSTMNLYIVDYNAIVRDVITRSGADTFFRRIQFFIDEVYNYHLKEEIEPSTPAYDLVDELLSKRNDILKFKLHLLTTKDTGQRTISWDINSIRIDNKQIEYQVWDLKRIFLICSSNLGRENIEIDFKKYTQKGIPCIEATEIDGNDFKSYLCIIPGHVIAEIYDEKGSALLEGNVRSFLSTKVAVNKKIRETILREPNRFFAYNNGISATAMNLKFDKNTSGLFITYAEDFQIINGGQTTATLLSSKLKDNAVLSNIFVAMKLTAIDSRGGAIDLIRNISKSSNSQNKVSEADFFSTHPFHVLMENFSQRIYAPATNGHQYETRWFYERARGQYFQAQMKLTPVNKKKFLVQFPKEQLVTKTDLAKYRNSWGELPQIVSKGAQTNFIKFAENISVAWETNKAVFNEKYFKESMAIGKLFKEIEKLVTNQPWYQNGYRANIVTYSIAMFHYFLEQYAPNYIFDLTYIWNKQKVPEEVLEIFKIITPFVNKFITTSSVSETANVTQWCKRDKCWLEMKKQGIALRNFNINPILPYLKLREDEKIDERDAKKAQREENKINDEVLVFNYGAKFWQDLYQFCSSHGLIKPIYEKAFYPAMQIPNCVPSAKQAKILLEAFEMAKAEGFVEVPPNIG